MISFELVNPGWLESMSSITRQQRYIRISLTKAAQGALQVAREAIRQVSDLPREVIRELVGNFHYTINYQSMQIFLSTEADLSAYSEEDRRVIAVPLAEAKEKAYEAAKRAFFKEGHKILPRILKDKINV